MGSSECRIGAVRTLFGKIPKRVSRAQKHENSSVAPEPCTFSLLKRHEFRALFFAPTSSSTLSTIPRSCLRSLSTLLQSSESKFLLPSHIRLAPILHELIGSVLQPSFCNASIVLSLNFGIGHPIVLQRYMAYVESGNFNRLSGVSWIEGAWSLDVFG